MNALNAHTLHYAHRAQAERELTKFVYMYFVLFTVVKTNVYLYAVIMTKIYRLWHYIHAIENGGLP